MNKKISQNGVITFIHPEFSHKDSRGVLIQLVSKGWNQVNYILSEPNSVRGDHYHKANREAFYIIEGKFILKLNILNTVQKFLIEEGDFFVIEKNILHSFEFITKTHLISMYDIGVCCAELKLLNKENKDIHVE